jgi:hypothetical protein
MLDGYNQSEMEYTPHKRTDQQIKDRLQGEHNGTWICAHCKDVVELYDDVIGVEICMCQRYNKQYRIAGRKERQRVIREFPKIFIYKSQLKGGDEENANTEGEEES